MVDLRRRHVGGLALVLTLGCGAAERSRPPPGGEVPADRTVAAPAAAPAPTAGASPAAGPAGEQRPAPATSTASFSRPPSAEPTTPRRAFPPDDVEPPFERSAQPGDGRWVPVADRAAGDRAAAPPRTMVKTVLHPHPVSRFESVMVVALDLTRLAIHFAPGTDDPRVEGLPDEHPPGLVPRRWHDDLLVVFNGGFKPRHGGHGMMIAGQVLVDPKPDSCTIALSRDGGVQIGSWSALAHDVDQMQAYRQTPPCLLDGGKLHPDLAAGQPRAWGGRSPKRKTRRRTALGIDDTGTLLLFGMGIELGPRRLAEGMRRAGAVAAAQLDINWSWTRFLLFGKPSTDAPLQVTSTLIPKMVHARRGYVERPAFRDFFYVTRRDDAAP